VNLLDVPNATVDTDKFLVIDTNTIKYRTGVELLSDIGAQPAGDYVPITRTLQFQGAANQIEVTENTALDLSADRGWVFNLHSGIISDIGLGVAAYGWGDHALEGYLTEFIEEDPIFTAWRDTNITSDYTIPAWLGENLTTSPISILYSNVDDYITYVLSQGGTMVILIVR